MNNEEFVEAIRKAVYDGAIEGLLKVIEHPPGRKVSPRKMARAEWYKSLDLMQRRFIDDTVKDTIRATINNIFCVLDGVMSVDPDPQSRFELRYVSSTGETTILNPPGEIFFYELWGASAHRT